MAQWKRQTSVGCSENPGVMDTGRGSLCYYEYSDEHPLIERIREVYYAQGRGPGGVVYRPLAGPNTGCTYPTVVAAEAAAAGPTKEPDGHD